MKANIQNVLQDVFYHLDKLEVELVRFKIDNNKNDILCYSIDKFINTIDLIKQIIKSYDNKNLKELYNEINTILFNNNELHGLIIHIKKKTKLADFDFSKTALIKFEI